MTLLFASAIFYWLISRELLICGIFLLTVAISYFGGVIINNYINQNHLRKAKISLAAFIAVIVLPLLFIRCSDLVSYSILHTERTSLIIPIGISFYTLQIIAYFADIFHGRIKAQRNFLKYALFISFFPQIIQGPIPRYEILIEGLFEGHRFDTKKFMNGIQLIIWGFFMKFMIADKASIVVDAVFDNAEAYKGVYVWVAAVLYSIQLYADFLGCVTICQGVAGLFGIKLGDNFKRPYFSKSIREFWRSWHISLSTWLRDYIYIPLGGSRKGTFAKYVNLLVTFIVSGLWHGGHWNYICWGVYTPLTI